jgi:hypothetical protein
MVRPVTAGGRKLTFGDVWQKKKLSFYFTSRVSAFWIDTLQLVSTTETSQEPHFSEK